MNRKITKVACVHVIFALMIALAFCSAALAESYKAATMRLLHYEGSVEIEDESGGSRFVMENARFNSGESLRTGAGSSASVSLDDTKIVTLAAESHVQFARTGNALKLTLTEGSLFLDVSEKLSDDETLDIETSTMVVGIRGTIVFVSVVPADQYAAEKGSGLEEVLAVDASGGKVAMLGVLEGTAQITYRDEATGSSRTMAVDAGQKATLVDTNENGLVDGEPEPIPLDPEDLGGFVSKQLEDPELLKRVENASDAMDLLNDFSAEGDWTWEGTVTLVAQSASKMYDGTPLTRRGDVLVYGLPGQFRIRAVASGSRTDAGESPNPIGSYTIYNARGQDVTGHFPHIETVDGQLVVDPAPITVWTASAEKVYDGAPLTAPEAEIHTYHGFEASQPVWRNTSYVATEKAKGYLSVSFTSETLYGVSGVTWVHGTNPLTGETKEIELRAGQKMTVYLSDQNNQQSIEFQVEELTEAQVPVEILRLYAANPALLAQACADTGWDMKTMILRIDALPKDDTATVEASTLYVEKGEQQRLMIDATNVRINVDTDITDYNDRALGKDEAHYVPVSVDQSIVVTATGSQTDVGSSENTYEINWGGAKPSNYVLREELGTLTVTPATLTVTTGSASKAYDGRALTNDEVTITGFAEGESAAVTATGRIRNVGSIANSYGIEWGSAKESNYVIKEELGTLTVTANDGTVTFTSATASKTYDGTALTEATVTVSGLPSGFTVEAAATGSQRDAGSSENTISSYKIFDEDGEDVTASFPNLRLNAGTLTVEPATLTVTTGSASKHYDGSPLTCDEITVEGLVEGDEITATATGAITDEGTADNTYTIDWGSVNPGNYTVAEELGTLEVKAPLAITITAASASKNYDGTALTANSYTVMGLPDGSASESDGYWHSEQYSVEVTVSGSQTDAGSSANRITEYHIWYEESGGDGNMSFEGVDDVTDKFAVTLIDGTLTVDPIAITITTGSASKDYDGTPLTEASFTVDGLPASSAGNAFSADVSLSGSQTDAGSSANTIGEYHIWHEETGGDPGFYWASDEDATANFTVTVVEGTLTVNPIEATVFTGSAEKVYDGKALTSSEGYINGLVEGDEVSVTATGSITDAGSADNTYTIDWGGVNSDNYILSDELGTLTVHPNDTPITITAGSAEKDYDGTPLTTDEADTTGLPSGFFVVPEISGSQTDAGESASTVSGYTIYTEAEEDATENFTNVTTESGSLKVNKRRIGIELDTSKDPFNYDGKLHYHGVIVTVYHDENDSDGTTLSGVDQGDGHYLFAFDWGDVLDVELTLKQTNAGTYALAILDVDSPGWCTASLTPGNPDNYDFSYRAGSVQLRIKPNDTPITITAGSAEKSYDGTPLTIDEADVTGLPSGFFVVPEISGSQTDPGESASTVSGYTIYTDAEEDATENFTNVTTESGSLKVNKRRIGISLDTSKDTFTYDGKLHYLVVIVVAYHGEDSADGTTTLSAVDQGDGHYRVTLDWGDVLDVELTRKETNAGTYNWIDPNSSSWCEGSIVIGNPENYRILESGGAWYLNINPVAATVTTGSSSKEYDGTPLTNSTASITGLINGETATVTATGSITEVGTATNTYSINWGTANASNYTITENLGTLTVTRISDAGTILYTWDGTTGTLYTTGGDTTYILLDKEAFMEYYSSVRDSMTTNQIIRNLLAQGIIRKP